MNIRASQLNPLAWPFLLATGVYAVAFTLLHATASVTKSSLHTAMLSLGAHTPWIWGLLMVLTLVLGLLYVTGRWDWAGRASSFLGAVGWIFAGICWLVTGGWILTIAIAVPNIYYWFYQYLDLRH